MNMAKVKLVERYSEGGELVESYLPVRLVEIKKMSAEGRKHWTKKARKKIFQYTFSTLPRTRKLHTIGVDKVTNKNELKQWLLYQIDNGMRVQIQRYVHKRGMPRKISTFSFERRRKMDILNGLMDGKSLVFAARA